MNMRLWPALFLAVTTLLTAACYQSGLSGPFLFDDAPNLEALGRLGGVRDWATLKAYVLSGWSGPTGRPISLVSFLLDDNTWPSTAYAFKLTNLKLHLICGLLLAWATLLLLRGAHWPESRAQTTAVLSASLWMLHPFLASTTLYVVQRMTVLSALFVLTGMVGYLQGRLWLVDARRPVWQGYALMSVSTVLGTGLAVLSKENGALLPLLLLVVEGFLRRVAPGGAPRNWWTALVLGLPSAAVVMYLLRLVDFSPNPWPTRPFNQVERLLTEARIIWDYLGNLWQPRIEGSGLYQDGLAISHRLTEPLSTLWAVLALGALLGLLPWLYRRCPYLWLALAFFLCGHLIESTVVGLELYFEHRNYAPALFMFLPLAVGINWLRRTYGNLAAGVAPAALLALLATLTWQRAELWRSDAALQTYWALHSPQSARGRNYLISRLVKEQRYEEALQLAEQATRELPQSSLLTLSWLRLAVNMRQATAETFEGAQRQLVVQPFDAQTVSGLRVLVDDVIQTEALAAYRPKVLYLVQYMAKDGPYRQFPVFMRLASYLQAQLYASMGDSTQSLAQYRAALRGYGNATAAMQMFAELAGSGYNSEAAALLGDISEGVRNGTLDTNPLGATYYLQEIERFEQALNE